MASTRNRNTESNYCLEQRWNKQTLDYNLYNHGTYGEAYENAFPEFGIIPSRMSRNALSNNYIDIESRLYGINSTNLVEPQQPIMPELKTLPNVKFFEKMALILPQEFKPMINQRPFPIPN